MKKFRRSITNRRFLGLLGAMGDYLQINANILRLIFLVLTILTRGTAIILYCLVAYLIPSEPISKLFEKQFFKTTFYSQDNMQYDNQGAYYHDEDITFYNSNTQRKDVTPK